MPCWCFGSNARSSFIPDVGLRMAQARPQTFKSRQSQTEMAISYHIAPPKSFPR